MNEVVIVAATRTAIGSFQGALANVSAVELGAAVIRQLLQQTGLDPAQVDEVILGQVLTAGAGQNPARQAAVKAGIEPSESDIDDELAGLAEQNGLESGDDVLAALKEQGLSEDEVRADLATQFQVSTYIEQKADIAVPSDEELQQQYDALVEQQSAAADAGGEIPPFEDVKDQLADQAKMQQENEAAQGIVEQLRDGADPKIHL